MSVAVDDETSSLIAFVSPADSDVDAEELCSELAKRLPRYMIPSRIYGLPKLPLNSNDKVDHKLIQRRLQHYVAEAQMLTSGTPRSTDSYISGATTATLAPAIRTPSDNSEDWETVVEDAWKAVLGSGKTFKSNANFFEEGGNR